MSSEVAVHKGIWIRNFSACPEIATIAVTGLGRSGTTMVSRILSELGLSMGRRLTQRSHEDKEIQLALKAADMGAFGHICAQRNSQPKWGFKCPALRAHLNRAAALMRNPRFILLVRDILAVTLRTTERDEGAMLEKLSRAANGYRQMVETMRDCPHPMLVLSYEKALQFPLESVQAIAHFCALAGNDDVMRRASALIRNGDPRYTGESRQR